MFSSLNIPVLSNVIEVTFLSCSKASIAYVITLNPLLNQILTNNNNNDNDNDNNNNNNTTAVLEGEGTDFCISSARDEHRARTKCAKLHKSRHDFAKVRKERAMWVFMIKDRQEK